MRQCPPLRDLRPPVTGDDVTSITIREKAAAVVALAKPRLAAMSVLTTLGAYAAAGGRPAAGWTGVVALLGGTLFSAAGALAFNQWSERTADAAMQRTRGRPLPQGQLTPRTALAWSGGLAVAGVAVLAFTVNGAAAGLGAATIGLYGLVYTPLKRRTRWATEVGAIPGALPPLIGLAAADHPPAAAAALAFAVLYFWQLPHFFAIGWVHRADYRAAGFRLLPAIDPDGRCTACWARFYAWLLGASSLVFWLADGGNWALGLVVFGAGGWLIGCAHRFAATAGDRTLAARRLFRATLWYLPLALVAIVLGRIR